MGRLGQRPDAGGACGPAPPADPGPPARGQRPQDAVDEGRDHHQHGAGVQQDHDEGGAREGTVVQAQGERVEAADQEAVAQDLDGADACPSSRQIKNMYKRQNSGWKGVQLFTSHWKFPKKRENASIDEKKSTRSKYKLPCQPRTSDND